MKRVKGFTLIELVIVLALLAILAAVAVPRFVNLSNKARRATATSELGSLRSAAQLFYASAAVDQNPRFPPTTASLLELLDQDPTQLDSNPPFAAATDDFGWLYNTTDGAVWSSGGAGWGW